MLLERLIWISLEFSNLRPFIESFHVMESLSGSIQIATEEFKFNIPQWQKVSVLASNIK